MDFITTAAGSLFVGLLLIGLKMTIYTSIISRGITLTPSLIFIPNWAKGNAAYLAHEQVHAEQQKRDGTITFWRRYLTNQEYRQAMEVEAYKAQIAAGASLITCAMHLATEYNLGITQDQAMKLLE